MIDRLLQLYAHAPEHPGKLRLFSWLHRGLRGRKPMHLSVAGGLRMHLRPDDHIERCLIFNDWHEPLTTQFILANLQPDMVALVAGAHIGYYVMHAARAVGPAGRVLTSEPAPTSLVATLRHLEMNDLRNNVLVACVALGEQEGYVPMAPPPAESRGMASVGGNGEPLPYHAHVETLVSLLRQFDLPGADLVQLDIEGMEWAALRGMGTLRPRLLILESDPRLHAERGEPQAEFCAFLRNLGYALFTVIGAPLEGTGYFPENNIVAAHVDGPPPRWPKSDGKPSR